MSENFKKHDVIKAIVAGSEAEMLRTAAEFLFEAGGKRLLGSGAQQLVRAAITGPAEAALAMSAPQLLIQGAKMAVQGAEVAGGELAKSLGAEVTKSVARETAKVAGKEVLRGVARGAGIGFVIDGVVSSVEAVRGYNRGEMTTGEAFGHVGKEAASGAIATGVGVAVAAALVTLTGGLAAPVLFVVGAGTSIAAKLGLRALLA